METKYPRYELNTPYGHLPFILTSGSRAWLQFNERTKPDVNCTINGIRIRAAVEVVRTTGKGWKVQTRQLMRYGNGPWGQDVTDSIRKKFRDGVEYALIEWLIDHPDERAQAQKIADADKVQWLRQEIELRRTQIRELENQIAEFSQLD